MIPPPIPANERERLQALKNYELWETPPEAELDRLTQLMAKALEVPVSLISLVGEDEQWFKSCVGLEATGTPKDVSFCGHAVAANAALIVPDALEDPRFADNPLVVGEPNIRFYAGFPLRTTDGFSLGTLCAIDRKPRALTETQLATAEALAGVVQSNLRMRYRQQTAEADPSKKFRMFVEMGMHDLKNPLFVVMGLAALIKDDPDLAGTDPTIRGELVDSANMIHSRLMSIMDLMAEMEGHGMKLERAPLPVGNFMQRVLRQGVLLASSSGRSLEGAIAPDCGEVMADPGVMERMLENLIQNAVKFGAPGGRILVEASREGDHVAFSVTDDGPGVPESARTTIFEPFVIGNGSSMRGSVGLGLAFCKVAAESHGGKIRVENGATGHGAKFVARIPARLATGRSFPGEINQPGR